jgi:hypothetical protein
MSANEPKRRACFLVVRVFLSKDGGACGSNISYWHKADILTAVNDVCFWG